jgi:phosphoribosylamine-glycine ligase
MASKGYPGDYEKGKVIEGLKEVSRMDGVFVFHAGTALKDGRIITNGGRVLGVAGLGEDIPRAIERTYQLAKKISGMEFSIEPISSKGIVGYEFLLYLLPLTGELGFCSFFWIPVSTGIQS